MKNLSYLKGRKAFWCLIFLSAPFLHPPAHAANPRSETYLQQESTVSGTISDATGTLPGVSVSVLGKNTFALSDSYGRYTIAAAEGDILLFSYIGYAERQINAASSKLDVLLMPDSQTLQEVTVNAGYYKVKNRERTGSISKITAKEIGIQPVNNPLEALQGRMTGVDIVQTSGLSGSGFEVKIRGQNSIMAGSAPLYIIDGVPYDSQSLGAASSSQTILPAGNASPLNAINPGSIESIEVLKDADATAIYGSRGANGVVLITTKKGKSGRTAFTFSSSTAIANITRKRPMIGREEYLEMRHEAFANDGITDYPANAYDINGTWDQDRNTDWQQELIGRTATTSQLQASVSGGSETTKFLLDALRQTETTIFPGDFSYARSTVNSNLQHSSPDKRFQLTFGASYAIEDNLLPGNDLTSVAYRLAPTAPALYDTQGALNWENSTWTNPLGQLKSRYESGTRSLITNATLGYRLLDNLRVKVNAGYNSSTLEDTRNIPHTIYNPAFGLNSSISQSYAHTGKRNSYLLESQADWNWKGNTHAWNVTLGTTLQRQSNDLLTLAGTGYSSNSFLGNLGAAASLRILNENSLEYNYQSFFARANYAYKDKIFLNATGRRDGSSRFGPGNRFGTFGAIGAAYLFSEDLGLSWLSLGKLRGSYGITGNDQIGDYQYLQTYMIADYPYSGNIGLVPSRLSNLHYKWEQNEKREAAVELGFLQGRLTLSAAYYSNTSSNQLINYALPATTGFASIQANLDAEVRNSGWEIEMGGTLAKGSNFSWTASFNLSAARSELRAFPGLADSPYANRFEIGKSLSIVKLYSLQGVDSQTGLFSFTDYDGDGRIGGAEDRQHVADLTPKFHGGVSNSITWGNWNADVFFQFVKKHGTNEYFGNATAGTLAGQPAGASDRWQQPGDQAPMQRYTSGADPQAFLAYSQFTQSSGAISDASFIRLKSLAVSYTLSLGTISAKSCRFSIQSQNLLTFTKFKGGDPEQSIGFLPPMRRVTFSVLLQL